MTVLKQITVGFIVLLLGLLMPRSCEEKKTALCEQRERITQEVITLLSEVTVTIQHEMGIPEVCYMPDHEELLHNIPPEQLQTYNKYRKNAGLLDDKIRSISHNQETWDILEKFQDASREFEKKCGQRDDEYKVLFRNLTNTKESLVEQLIIGRKQCLE